jgi:hypothetical protein
MPERLRDRFPVLAAALSPLRRASPAGFAR